MKKTQAIYILEQFYSLLLLIPLVIFLVVSFKFLGYKKVDIDLIKEINNLFLTDKVFIYNFKENLNPQTSVLVVYCNKDKTTPSTFYLNCDYKLLFSEG